METLKLSFKGCLCEGFSIFYRETSCYFAVDFKIIFKVILPFLVALAYLQYWKIQSKKAQSFVHRPDTRLLCIKQKLLFILPKFWDLITLSTMQT